MEKSSLYRKGIAVFVIVLFIGIGVIQSTGTNIKITNKEKYSENSTICGYITDFETGEPIYQAWIEFFIDDYQGNHYDYYAESDENGFYIVENVVTGYCVEYMARKSSYHAYFGYGGFDIPENATVWVNMSMFPRQPETSEVRGYVYDNYTGKPIYNLQIVMHWFDINGQLSYNGSFTDENGYYSMNMGAGRFSVHTYTDDYIVQWAGMYNVSDYELFWINFSLDPVITIKILKPENGIYFKNKKIFPFKFPIIIGPIGIEFNVTLIEGYYPIDHVELLIDNVSKQNYTYATEPYIYHWDNKTPFRFRHTIKIIAHREYYNNRERELEVWKFF